MKYLSSLIILTSLLSVSQAVLAEDKKPDYTDGNEFVARCGDMAKNPEKMAWCKGFMVGFDQGHTTMSYVTRKGKEFDIGKDGLLYCPPDNVTHVQAITLVIDYIKSHPKEAHLPAGLLTAYTLHDKFPCEKKPEANSQKKPEDKFSRD